MAKMSSRYWRFVVCFVARSNRKFISMEHMQILLKYICGPQRPQCCLQSLVLGPHFWRIWAESSLIPKRRKAHEDTVTTLPTTLRVTLSFIELWPYMWISSISKKLWWELQLYYNFTMLFWWPWDALWLRAVEGADDSMSIQGLRTCSLGSEPN